MKDWRLQLREKYQWPNTDGVESYYFSFDGGGRQIILNEIERRGVKLVLELGCFLCGSAIQWMEVSGDLEVIGVDPWEGDWVSPLSAYLNNPAMKALFEKIPSADEFLNSLRIHGPYKSALANVRRFGSRFFPIRAFSPGAVSEIKEMGIYPDLIYFDNDKRLDDLHYCYKLFPDSILTGDDWTWKDESGSFVVQKAVLEFCRDNNFKVEVSHASWIIRK